MSAMPKEIEAKFLNIMPDVFRQKMIELGATPDQPSTLMRRKTFFPPDGNPNKWGRVRDEGTSITATIKERNADTLDGTAESEIIVTNFDAACAFLLAAGFTPNSTQENYRESWWLGPVFIALDTWPGINPLVEIEGPTEKDVTNLVEQLEWNMSFARYGGMAGVYESELGIPKDVFNALPSLTFSEPPISRLSGE